MDQFLPIWPVAKWILQALGLMGPEDKEKEREYQLKLLEAAERKDAEMIAAWQQFQTLWRPPAERVYVWANTVIALFQPLILAAIYYDIVFGPRKSISVANDLQTAGIPGLLIMAIMLFPFYGAALVSGVGKAFQSAVDLAVSRKPEPKPGTSEPAPLPSALPTPLIPARPERPEPARSDRDG